MNSLIKVIFFDIDDTLLSFTEYVKEAMKSGFQKFGLKPYTEEMFPIFWRINGGLWRRIERGELTLEELQKIRWNSIFQELGIEFDGMVFEKEFRERLFYNAIPEPHAMEVLEYLADRYILCVTSNGPYEQQMNRLRVGNMYDFFRHFFISEKVGCQKPGKGFFDYCFQELHASGLPDLRPSEVLIVGDSETSDIAGGVQYGLHTCLYRREALPVALSKGAEYAITDLADLKELL